MGEDSFTYKTKCELMITSGSFTPEAITALLDISPSRAFKKGGRNVSKHSGAMIIKQYNLWALTSPEVHSFTESIDIHIAFFMDLLDNKQNIIEEIKNSEDFDVSFYIWIETDNAGIGLDINGEHLQFVSSISNRVHFTLLCLPDTFE
jgi:hypothetical protein